MEQTGWGEDAHSEKDGSVGSLWVPQSSAQNYLREPRSWEKGAVTDRTPQGTALPVPVVVLKFHAKEGYLDTGCIQNLLLLVIYLWSNSSL